MVEDDRDDEFCAGRYKKDYRSSRPAVSPFGGCGQNEKGPGFPGPYARRNPREAY